MHVGINGHLLSFGASYRGAGISRYIGNLIGGLPSALGDSPGTVFIGDGRLPDSLKSNGLEYVVSRLPTVSPSIRIVWEQLLAPLECARRRIDVLHSTAYVQPLLTTARSVVTVHDLSFYRYPDLLKTGNRMYLGAMTRLSLRRANRIIAVSESTRDDVVRILGIAESRVDVVYHGIEPEFHPVAEGAVLEDLRRRRGLPDKFILCVATLEPRKSLDVLVRAYADAKKHSGFDWKLVLVGGKGWDYEGLLALIERLAVKDDVRLPGFVPVSELPLWYNLAGLFVYPSRYEGFGMPVLEAMACGTPVVVSRASSLPEVVGDAGAYVPVGDIGVLAETILDLCSDPGKRDDLGRRAVERASRFRWENAARQTVDVYRSSV